MLDTSHRETLAALADILIPGSDSMPSAGDVGVSTDLIDQTLEYRPDLQEPLTAALNDCSGKDPEAAIDDLAGNQPDAFATLSTAVSGAYLLSPDVITALGHRPAPRVARDDLDSVIEELSEVMERGFERNE